MDFSYIMVDNLDTRAESLEDHRDSSNPMDYTDNGQFHCQGSPMSSFDMCYSPGQSILDIGKLTLSSPVCFFAPLLD
jgi:hypothetical protein